MTWRRFFSAASLGNERGQFIVLDYPISVSWYVKLVLLTQKLVPSGLHDYLQENVRSPIRNFGATVIYRPPVHVRKAAYVAPSRKGDNRGSAGNEARSSLSGMKPTLLGVRKVRITSTIIPNYDMPPYLGVRTNLPESAGDENDCRWREL